MTTDTYVKKIIIFVTVRVSWHWPAKLWLLDIEYYRTHTNLKMN